MSGQRALELSGKCQDRLPLIYAAELKIDNTLVGAGLRLEQTCRAYEHSSI